MVDHSATSQRVASAAAPPSTGPRHSPTHRRPNTQDSLRSSHPVQRGAAKHLTDDSYSHQQHSAFAAAAGEQHRPSEEQGHCGRHSDQDDRRPSADSRAVFAFEVRAHPPIRPVLLGNRLSAPRRVRSSNVAVDSTAPLWRSYVCRARFWLVMGDVPTSGSHSFYS